MVVVQIVVAVIFRACLKTAVFEQASRRLATQVCGFWLRDRFESQYRGTQTSRAGGASLKGAAFCGPSFRPRQNC